MIVKNGLRAALATALGVALAVPVAQVAQADDISTVEGARAKERQGRRLNAMDREQLRRHGGNDDYGYRYRGDGYYYGAYDGPGVSVYVAPRRYYGPYGY